MKAKRLNKRANKTKRLNTRDTRKYHKPTVYKKIDNAPTDNLTGRTVVLKTLPEDIKKAKRLFTVGDKYIIQNPEASRLNTFKAVYLKGRDKNLYQISFNKCMLLPND